MSWFNSLLNWNNGYCGSKTRSSNNCRANYTQSSKTSAGATDSFQAVRNPESKIYGNRPIQNTQIPYLPPYQFQIDDYDKYMINKIKNRTITQMDCNNWCDVEYNKLRRIDTNRIFRDDSLQYAIDNPRTKGTYVLYQSPWKYRLAGNVFTEKDRASLNVIGHAGLINELDYFMKTGVYKYCNSTYKVGCPQNFYYKTYADASRWYTREDPVTFYFDGKINNETYLALVRISQKYQNGALHNTEGKIGNWFAVEKSPREELIYPLIMEAQNINSTLADYINKKAVSYDGYVLSAGRYEACCNMIKKINLSL